MPFIVVDKQSKLLKTPSIDKCQRLFVKLDFFFSYGNTTTQTSSLNQTNPKFAEVSHWDKPAHTMFLKSDIRQNLEKHNKKLLFSQDHLVSALTCAMQLSQSQYSDYPAVL